MSFLYELMFLAGVRPWERGGIVPELQERAEGRAAPPPGRALDIGCGTGGPAVYLASHGWEVTGIDNVARALRRARTRAAAAGVSPRLLHADVSRLADVAFVAGGFWVVFGAGGYPRVDGGRRGAQADAGRGLAAPEAAMLLFALTPGGKTRPRSFRGASDEELEARFGQDWELVWKQPHAGPPVFGGAGQFWYLLRKRARGSKAEIAGHPGG